MARASRHPGARGRVAWVGCELENVIAGGDHVIVTGSVLEVEHRDGAPLIFHAGAYRPFDPGA